MAVSIVLAADHRGYYQKNMLKEQDAIGHHETTWLDMGAFTPERSDYPEYAIPACHAMLEGKADRGIFLCGSGAGMAIVANRFRYLYAAVVWDQMSARLAREDDNTDVLCLPSDWLDNEQVIMLVDVWLSAEFQAGRYAQRLRMMNSI